MLFVLAPVGGCGAEPTTAADAPLILERTIPLKGVGGRIDHLVVDAAHQRLFVAELGNGSVEALDLARGASLGRISGLKEPQGLAYLPERNELVVASGGDGMVRFYRADDLSLAGSLALGDDADNVRVDPRSGRLIIGYGSGALAVIDPASRAVVARIAMPAHPESFRLNGDRVWVNVPDARRIVVADLQTGRIAASWPARHGFNFPMALDAPSHILAIVFRLPARLQMLAADTGATRADVATCGDADDVFFDSKRPRLYVICGAGAVDVVDTVHVARMARIVTRSGARTGLFSAELDRLFIAARASSTGGDAALLVYRPRP
ncbi:MAG TPA: hypothetical protein VGI79_01475 [Caulobacteraceae bacterium]|jgi:hypothetical protein